MIKIEVTGASIPEVADKLIAIGRSLKPGGLEPLYPWDLDPKAKTKSILERMFAEVAEQAPSPEPVSEATEAPSAPATSPESGTPTSDTGPTAETASPTELNFDTDVAPIVLQVVKEKGKPVAQDILAQFGVEKASLLDPAQWPELVSLLKEQL